MYSLQYFYPSLKAFRIIGRAFRASLVYFSTKSSSDISSDYCFFACSMKNCLNLLGKSSKFGFLLFSSKIVFKSFLLSSYSSLTLENLRSFRSLSSTGSNRKLFTFFNYSSSIYSCDFILARASISSSVRVGAIFSPKLILLYLSNSSKYSTTLLSTFSIPSMITNTPILSELIFSLVTIFEMFSAIPANVLFNIRLSSLYMHTHMASSIPP